MPGHALAASSCHHRDNEEVHRYETINESVDDDSCTKVIGLLQHVFEDIE